MIVVLRSTTPELMDEALNGLGVEVYNRTPYLETTTGISCSFWLFPDQMDKLPTYIDPPNVVCDWREDEENGDYWPEYTCTDGTNSWVQAAGRYA